MLNPHCSSPGQAQVLGCSCASLPAPQPHCDPQSCVPAGLGSISGFPNTKKLWGSVQWVQAACPPPILLAISIQHICMLPIGTSGCPLLPVGGTGVAPLCPCSHCRS